MKFPSTFIFFRRSAAGDFPPTNHIPKTLPNVTPTTLWYRERSKGDVIPMKARPVLLRNADGSLKIENGLPAMSIVHDLIPTDENPAYLNWCQIGEHHSFVESGNIVFFYRFISHAAYAITFQSAEELVNFIDYYGKVSFNSANTTDWFEQDRYTPVENTIELQAKD